MVQDHYPPWPRGSPSLISLSRLQSVRLLLLFEPSDLPKPFVFSSGLHFNAPRMSFNDGEDQPDPLAMQQKT